MFRQRTLPYTVQLFITLSNLFTQHILALRLLQCMILTMHLTLAGNKDMFDGAKKRNGTAFGELNPGALAGCTTNSSTFSTTFTVRVGAWLHWHCEL